MVGPVDNNVFVLRCTETGDAVLLDAANEHERLLELCQRLGVRRVLETHGHWDHIQAVPELRDAGYSVGVTAADAAMLPAYDEVIEDDSVIEVGRLRLHTIATPGHTPGSMCFRLEGSPVLFSGDTLFPGGPGNTTFEGGDFPTIIESIDRRLFTLPARHARAPRPRRRHHDRRRAPAPPGVGRPGLVTELADGRPAVPPAARRPHPGPHRRPAADADPGPHHPGHGVDRGARRRCSPSATTSRRGPSPLQAPDRALAAVAGRARPRRPTPGTGPAASTTSADACTFRLHPDGTGEGTGPSGAAHDRFRTWKEDLRDHPADRDRRRRHFHYRGIVLIH